MVGCAAGVVAVVGTAAAVETFELAVVNVALG